MPKSVPNYLTVDTSGGVGADFSGHVHAKGLDLDAGTTSTPPDADRVRWIEQPGGAVVASQYGYYDGTSSYSARAAALGATDDAASSLIAHGGNGTDTVITARAKNAVHPASVDAAFVQVAGLAATILDGNGASSFVQLGNVQMFNAFGPTPVGWNVTVKSPTVYIAVQISAFSVSTGSPSGHPIFFDGAQVGGFNFFWNVANQHLTLPIQLIKLTNQTPGVKVLSVNSSGSNQVVDTNDQLHALVLN